VILKAREFERIVSKLQLQTRNTGDRHAWFEYEGKAILWTKRSNKRGDLPFAHAIRQQLKLNEAELKKLVGCTLDRDGYIKILRKRGLIPD
jgi:hypothetical protein